MYRNISLCEFILIQLLSNRVYILTMRAGGTLMCVWSEGESSRRAYFVQLHNRRISEYTSYTSELCVFNDVSIDEGSSNMIAISQPCMYTHFINMCTERASIRENIVSNMMQTWWSVRASHCKRIII